MKSRRPYAAFTLLELLTVIAIIGILAALVAPVLSQFRKGDVVAAATNQLQGDVARARQLAMSTRSTVYMVFVPTNFWGANPTTFINSLANPAQRTAATNLCDKQLTGYTFVSLRTVGDQPGRNIPHYLGPWRTLPARTFIAMQKFSEPANQYFIITDPVSGRKFPVYGFSTNAIPFPTENGPGAAVPCIAFNYLGQLSSATGQPLGRDDYIPLAQGSVLPAIDPATRALQLSSIPAIVSEAPPGNSTNNYNLIHIDWLTGRARLEHREVQ